MPKLSSRRRVAESGHYVNVNTPQIKGRYGRETVAEVAQIILGAAHEQATKLLHARVEDGSWASDVTLLAGKVSLQRESRKNVER
jgi:hypothetical protein